MRRKISCTIITLDEADRIERCLESVRGVVDEIVVVDSGSTDGTIQIAEKYGARCFHNFWVGFGQQKRLAEDLAEHEWILNIDADEWLTEELGKEITEIASVPAAKDIYGYYIDIKNVYPGADKPRLFADQHTYVRFYNKNECRFPHSAAFDEIKLSPTHARKLRGAMYHRSIRSISHLVFKNIRYYNLQIDEIQHSKFLFPIRLIFEPLAAFIKYYFLRRHVTGGCYGFVIASTMAMLRTYRLFVTTFSRPCR